MSRFIHGQKVVCIKDDYVNTEVEPIVKGHGYQVTRITIHERKAYLKLRGYPQDHNYHESYFAPLGEDGTTHRLVMAFQKEYQPIRIKPKKVEHKKKEPWWRIIFPKLK